MVLALPILLLQAPREVLRLAPFGCLEMLPPMSFSLVFLNTGFQALAAVLAM